MLEASLRGAIAGAAATVVMTLGQPIDKRLFRSTYDDVEILGKLVTRGDDWQPVGFVLHVQNGAAGRRVPTAQAVPARAGDPPRPAGGPHRAHRHLAHDHAGRPLPP